MDTCKLKNRHRTILQNIKNITQGGRKSPFSFFIQFSFWKRKFQKQDRSYYQGKKKKKTFENEKRKSLNSISSAVCTFCYFAQSHKHLLRHLFVIINFLNLHLLHCLSSITLHSTGKLNENIGLLTSGCVDQTTISLNSVHQL